MKRTRRVRRQVFVFTPEEKRAAWCFVAICALGLGTMRYREQHPQTPKLTAREQFQADKAAKAARAYSHSARAQRERDAQKRNASTPKPEPEQEPDEDDSGEGSP